MKVARRRVRSAQGIALVMGASLIAAACGSTGSSSSSSSSAAGAASSTSAGKTPTAPSGTVKMAAALITTKNDGSFGQATYNGMQASLKTFPNLKLTSVLENETTDALRTDGINTLSPLNSLVLAVSSSNGPILDN
ncbi:MAG: hypothetical protein ACRDNK_20315, partial [Solirubrobacteraceae bacterium]